MMSFRKSEILVMAIFLATCIALCQGAPSNSSLSGTKYNPSTYTRVQRSKNTTTSVTTSKPSPSSSSKTVSTAPHISHAARSATGTSNSSTTNNKGSSSTGSRKPQSNVPVPKGAVRSPSTFSNEGGNHKQTRNANTTSNSPVIKSVPVRVVPAAPKSSTDNEAGSLTVSSSHVPIKLPSPAKSNNSPAPNSKPTADTPSKTFVHHEEADH